VTTIALLAALSLASFPMSPASVSAPAAVDANQQQQPEPPATPPAQIAGKWTVSLEMDMGTATVTMEFKQDGEKVTGTYAGRYGTSPLEGTIKGRKMDFVVTTTIEGQASSLWFGGEVSEDGQSIRGPAELGGAGEAFWLAKRAKDENR
jgi:hypothetical protein